jgi:hypothetical protein
MKVIGEIVIPENGADRTAVSRRLKAGGLVKLVPGIYTSTVVDILPSLSLRSPQKRKGRGFLPAISPVEHGDGSGA